MSEVVIYPALFATVAFCFWTLIHQWSRRVRLKQVGEFRMQMLNRLMSADAGAFSRAEGDRIVTALIEDTPEGGLAERLLDTARAALVLLCLGGGLAFLSARDLFDEGDAFFVASVIALALGVGLSLSVLLSWRLGGRGGLLDRPRAGPADSD